MGAGRPSSFTQEIADEICYRLSSGEPLRDICRDEHIPAWRTIYDWKDANAEFSARFARAREIGYDALAAQCLEIADTPEHGEEITTKPDGTQEIRTGDMLGHRKLKIETRLKLLAKWHPQKYGDKQQVELGNKPGETFRSDVQVSPEEAYKKMLDGV